MNRLLSQVEKQRLVHHRNWASRFPLSVSERQTLSIMNARQYLMSPFSSYHYIIFLYDDDRFPCILLLTAFENIGVCKVTLFTCMQTISTFRTDPRSDKAACSKITLLTLVAGFKLVSTPLFNVEEFVVEGHWRGWTLRVWTERSRIVRWRRRLFSDHGFPLSVSWIVDRSTVGGIGGI
jgi:hypothetical protein